MISSEPRSEWGVITGTPASTMTNVLINLAAAASITVSDVISSSRKFYRVSFTP